MITVEKVSMKEIEPLNKKIEELKSSPITNKQIELNLTNTSGDISLVSPILTAIRKNKIKLHVSANGILSGAGIVFLAAGRRGKRESTYGTRLSFKDYTKDPNTVELLNVLKNIYKIDTDKLIASLGVDEQLDANNMNLLKLSDRITYAGRRINNPLIPKKAKTKSTTSNKNKDKKVQAEA
jgi:hypothetical protein